MARGTRIKDRNERFRKILKMAKRFSRRRARLAVGWFRESLHPEGVPTAQIAVHHEYGAPKANIPRRSMLRPIADRKSRSAGFHKSLRRAWWDTLIGGKRLKRTLAAIGQSLENAVKKRIDAGRFKRLKPATIARKGHARPLIDTGTMRDQVAWKLIT